MKQKKSKSPLWTLDTKLPVTPTNGLWAFVHSPSQEINSRDNFYFQQNDQLRQETFLLTSLVYEYLNTTLFQIQFRWNIVLHLLSPNYIKKVNDDCLESEYYVVSYCMKNFVFSYSWLRIRQVSSETSCRVHDIYSHILLRNTKETF